MIFVGVDTGGTFTDFVFFKEGSLEVLKVLSTPHNPAEAVLKGLESIGGQGRRVVHGSTVATNALLERKGARTAFVTNRGFEDILEIGRQNRERLYDLHYRRPAPLIPRELRLGVGGRVNHRGEIIEELPLKDVDALVDRLRELGVESVAVCLLHSYANPAHERELGEELVKLGIHVSLSHEILPEFREFERASTTAVNAYVSPKMEGYISYLEKNLGKEDSLSIMQSNGGIISSGVAKREAVRTVLSGPAGGVISALHVGRLTGFDRLITFDMGGTSTDVSLIEGAPTITTEAKINGLPIKVPMIDIHTIGAGGGSIAWIDEGGMLRVGPQSAGAEPGPVCYGRGGEDVTVTDANLFLGRLVPEYFLGGEMRLYPDRLGEPLRKLSEQLDTSPEELAEAILEVANSNMERALRKVSVQRGHDPQQFTLITFGGAGGLHAVFLARMLGIPKVLVPRNPGMFSALGMLLADTVKDYSLTVMLRGPETSYLQLEELFQALEDKAIEDMEREGFTPEELTLQRLLDMRYRGQSYELTVPLSEGYEESFHREHEKTYGYRHDRETEIVNIRLRATGVPRKPTLPSFSEKSGEDSSGALLTSVKTAFGGEFQETRVYRRESLRWGNRIYGPAIVVEYSSTTVLPPGSSAEVDRFGNLLIDTHE
ncbi:hydantoinase/oxoprolinase family protein [Hydrogenivirga sp. 128-5-R1-1]|uniref:hydantoinase/oxoprolinase family protein n=1 Tax=Hydrogenivirga sp. 128-5-R1-1 TaxID=392423 RepID=UPI00015F16BA|nr:hydantoinase/oxoprolinase family protein [Hydrogenivirga sp. 128-5-R1-1]EDP76245.1 N-methylhydantoinase A [Hydrogenivirga sp. 128-5-R1-1]